MNLSESRDTKRGPNSTYVVEKLVHGGEALLRTEQGVVFVRGPLPGERVRPAGGEKHKGRLTARSVHIVEESPSRRAARCPYFGVCGGCDWQHLEYGAQVEWKRRILAENFARIAGTMIEPSEIEAITGAEWGYRHRVQLHRDEKGRVGYHARGTNTIIEVRECPIAAPRINAELAVLNGAREGGDSGAAAANTGDTVSLGVGGVDASRTGSGRAGPRHARTTLFAAEGRLFRSDLDSEAEVEIAGTRFRFATSGFSQANRGLLPPLGRTLVKECAAGDLVDLYAGAGLLPFLIGVFGGQEVVQRRVTCVEPDRENASQIRANLVRSGRQAGDVTVQATTAERAVGSGRGGVSLAGTTVLLDPPRGGVGARVRRALQAGGRAGGPNAPGRLVYLSCDAASLARDAAFWTGSTDSPGPYRLRSLRLFDFFPQTAHIEALAVFEPRSVRDA